jgi:hypothetical protein
MSGGDEAGERIKLWVESGHRRSSLVAIYLCIHMRTQLTALGISEVSTFFVAMLQCKQPCGFF